MNKVVLVGRLGRDPEKNFTQGGTPVANLALATSEKRKDASGQWVEQTEWHTVVVFGSQAGACHQYLAKGSQVAIEGKIQTSQWQDKEGQKRYTTKVIADRVEFVGARVDRDSSSTSELIQGEMPQAQASFSEEDIPF